MKQSDQHNYLEKMGQIVEANFNNTSFGVEELAREMALSHSNLAAGRVLHYHGGL